MGGAGLGKGKRVERWVRSKRSGKILAVSPAHNKTDAGGSVTPMARLTGSLDHSFTEAHRLRNEQYWEELTEAQAEKLWAREVESLPAMVEHDNHLISGVILPIWDRLPRQSRVIRLQTDAGERFLGRYIEPDSIAATLQNLGTEAHAPDLSADQARREVLDGGVTLRLVNGWRVVRRVVSGERRLEVTGPDSSHIAGLRADGVMTERIQYKTRFFIPIGDAGVLGRILEEHPVAEVVGGNERYALPDKVPTVAENLRRGRAAIERVLSDETDIRGAMYRKELGWISFLWGDVKGGIDHIIERRTGQGIDAEAFVREIPDVIARGRMGPYYVMPNGDVNRNIVWDKKTVVLASTLYEDRVVWVLSGFPGRMQRVPPYARMVSEKEAEKRVSDAIRRRGMTPPGATQRRPPASKDDVGAETALNIGLVDAENNELGDRILDIARQLAPQSETRLAGRLSRRGDGATVAGKYLPDENLIRVSLTYGDSDMTVRHEAIHALRNLGLFTDSEWVALEREAKRSWRAEYEIDRRYGALSEEQLNEEAVADAFKHWQDGDRFAPGFRGIFERVRDFFQRVANMLRGLGYRTAEDVFRSVERGQVGRRLPTASRGESEKYSLPDARRVQGSAEVEDTISRIMAAPDDLSLRERAGQVIANIRNQNGLKFKQGFLDQFASIEHYEKAVTGRVQPGGVSAYKAAQRTQNLSSVVAASLKFGALRYNAQEGVFELKPDSKGLEATFQPLREHGLVHLWKGWAIAQRSKRLKEEGRENLLSDGDISVLGNLDQEHLVDGRNVFREVMADWQEFNTSMLDMAEAAGGINAEQRAMWEQNDYVPFYRVLDDGTLSPNLKTGIASQRTGIRRLSGGEAQIGDLLENMVLNTAKLIDFSFKNVATERTIAMLEGTGVVTAEAWDWKAAHVTLPQAQRALEEVGINLGGMQQGARETWLKMFTLTPPRDPNVIHVMRDGKAKYYRVHDPLLLRSLTSMNHRQMEGLAKLMRGAKRLLTNLITADPAFMLANAMRDTMSAWVQTGTNLRPGLDSMRGFVKSLREDTSLQAIMAAGGGSGGFYRTAPEDVRLLMEDHRRRIEPSTIVDTPRKAWELWQRIGAASENANRIAIYDQVLKEGGSKAEAVHQAQDLLNFSMRGDFAAMRFLVETVPFMNARLQGLYRLYRAGRDNPKTFLVRGTMLMGASLALLAANWDNPDYEKLPEWEKDAYYHLWVDGKQFRIPKPFEVGAIFSTIPERFIRAAAGRDDTELGAERLLAMFLDTFSLDPTPQLFAPIIEQVANRDFFRDRPIVGLGHERLRPEAQYKPSTSETAKLVGRVMPDALGPVGSPVRIEHLLKAYFGTLGGYLLGMSDALVGMFGDQAPRPIPRLDQLPVLKRFFREQPSFSTKWSTEFYDLKREADELYSTIRALRRQGDTARANELVGDNMPLLRARKPLNRMYRVLRTMNERTRAIYAHPTMDPDEKRRHLDALTVQRNRIYRQTEMIEQRLGL